MPRWRRPESSTIVRRLAELEKRYIALVLGECGGNKKRAAEKLGIDRRTLYRAIERSGDSSEGDEDGEG